MSKKLAIVKPAAINLPATTPPPRKEDIINAMVERARVKHQEEAEALEHRRFQAELELNNAVLSELKSHPDNFDCDVSAAYRSRPEIEYSMKVVPPHITKLKAAVQQIPCLRHFVSAEVKKQIRAKLDTAGDRVKALLENPAAVKALDATLEQIM